MSLRTALIAGLLLVLVSAAWWLLGEYAAQPESASGVLSVPTGQSPTELGFTASDDSYPAGYVDDLPLDDAPEIPPDVANDYVPIFEAPDLLGDGMLVPLEFEIGPPEVLLSEEETP